MLDGFKIPAAGEAAVQNGLHNANVGIWNDMERLLGRRTCFILCDYMRLPFPLVDIFFLGGGDFKSKRITFGKPSTFFVGLLQIRVATVSENRFIFLKYIFKDTALQSRIEAVVFQIHQFHPIS